MCERQECPARKEWPLTVPLALPRPPRAAPAGSPGPSPATLLAASLSTARAEVLCLGAL